MMNTYVRSESSPSVSWKVGSFQAFVEAKVSLSAVSAPVCACPLPLRCECVSKCVVNSLLCSFVTGMCRKL